MAADAASISFTSVAVSPRPAAARFSSSRASLRVPGIGTIHGLRLPRVTVSVVRAKG
jgi:hypothetical protein